MIERIHIKFVCMIDRIQYIIYYKQSIYNLL